MSVQACRLPALKPLKPLKPLKLCKSFAERPTAQAKATPRPHPSLLLGGPACRSPGVTCFKPFKCFNIPLACLIPQPTGIPRPHPWLLTSVQACRLPALKPLKPLKPLKRLKRLKPLKPLKLSKSFAERPTAQAKATPRPHPSLLLGGPACRSPGVTRFKPFKRFNILLACLIPQPTGTPRPHQWLLMGVQACRLPALKPLKPLKRLKPLKPLQLCKSFSERLPAQAKATPRPHPWLLMGVQACRLPALKPLKPLKRLKRLKPLKPLKLCKSFAERPTAQAKATPRPQTLQKLLGTLTRTGKSYPKATSMASYGRPSLPFARP